MKIDEYLTQRRRQEDLLSQAKVACRQAEELQDELALDDRDAALWLENFGRDTEGVPGMQRIVDDLWDQRRAGMRLVDEALEQTFSQLSVQQRTIEEDLASLESAWRASVREEQGGL